MGCNLNYNPLYTKDNWRELVLSIHEDVQIISDFFDKETMFDYFLELWFSLDPKPNALCYWTLIFDIIEHS